MKLVKPTQAGTLPVFVGGVKYTTPPGSRVAHSALHGSNVTYLFYAGNLRVLTAKGEIADVPDATRRTILREVFGVDDDAG